MKNTLKVRVKNALQNKKGFTLVELIVVTVIIMILATMATTSYLRFVEDAKVAKDTAYIKSIITQMEVLIANDKLSLPTVNVSSSTLVTGDTITLKIDGTTGAWNYSGTDADKATIQASCTQQDLTSVSGKKGVEIRLQVYNDIPRVFVYCATADASDYWYPYTLSWAGEDAWATT